MLLLFSCESDELVIVAFHGLGIVVFPDLCACFSFSFAGSDGLKKSVVLGLFRRAFL